MNSDSSAKAYTAVGHGCRYKIFELLVQIRISDLTVPCRLVDHQSECLKEAGEKDLSCTRLQLTEYLLFGSVPAPRRCARGSPWSSSAAERKSRSGSLGPRLSRGCVTRGARRPRPRARAFRVSARRRRAAAMQQRNRGIRYGWQNKEQMDDS